MSEKATLRAIIVLCIQYLNEAKSETVEQIYKTCSNQLHLIMEKEKQQ